MEIDERDRERELSLGGPRWRLSAQCDVVGGGDWFPHCALASCCCAPPLMRLFVRYGSGFETTGYLAIVVGLSVYIIYGLLVRRSRWRRFLSVCLALVASA